MSELTNPTPELPEPEFEVMATSERVGRVATGTGVLLLIGADVLRNPPATVMDIAIQGGLMFAAGAIALKGVLGQST